MGQLQTWHLCSDLDLQAGGNNAATRVGQGSFQPTSSMPRSRRTSRLAGGRGESTVRQEIKGPKGQKQLITSSISRRITRAPQHPPIVLRVPPVVMAASLHNASLGPPPIAGEVSRSTEGPTAQQWDERKLEIKDLYTRKPLKDVRAILEKRYGFRATDRMFKSRLSAWGFSKNSHDREYQICARLHKIRKEGGKPETLFIINKDTKRSLRDLRKYIKGRKMSEDEFVALAEENVSDEQLASDQTVRAMTPPAEGSLEERDSEPEGDPEMENAAPGYPAKISSPPSFFNMSHQNAHTHARQGPSTLMHLKHENSSPSSSNAFPSSAAAVRGLATQSQFQPQNAAPSPTTPASMNSSSHSMAFSHGNSPRRRRRSSCQYFDQHDVDVIAYQTVHCNSLPSTYGTNDLDAWKLLQRVNSADSSDSDYQIICPKCRELVSTHFRSLSRFNDSVNGGFVPSPSSDQTSTSSPFPASSSPSANGPPFGPRSLVNPTPDLPLASPSFSIPSSSKEHDHSWKWVSHSYLACIQLSRYSTSPTRHPEAAMLAKQALLNASLELEAMIRNDDEKIVLTLNQTLMVLHMHDQGEISRRIMQNAHEVALRCVGMDHPIEVITRFMALAAEPKVLKEKATEMGVGSGVLRESWEAYVSLCQGAKGERDLRSLGAMYCFGYMLNVEAGVASKYAKEAQERGQGMLQQQYEDEERAKLTMCEEVITRCYTLSCQRLGKGHLLSIQCLINLRLCFERQGRVNEAIDLAKRVCRDSLETLGKSHPRRLETIRNLAVMLLNRNEEGDAERAEQLYKEVLLGRVRMLGREHAWTLGMKSDYIELLKWADKWDREDGLWTVEREEVETLFADWDMVGDGSESEDEVNAGAF